MRFIDFINEAKFKRDEHGRMTRVDGDDSEEEQTNKKLLDISPYKKTLKEMVDHKIIFYRGQDFESEHGVDLLVNLDGENFRITVYKIQKRKDIRRSISGDQSLINLSSIKWKDLPDRKKSYFATQQMSHTGLFGGKPAIIIPADNVDRFAWAPEDFNLTNTSKGLKQKIIDISQGIGSLVTSLKTLINHESEAQSEAQQLIVKMLKTVDISISNFEITNDESAEQAEQLIEIIWKNKKLLVKNKKDGNYYRAMRIVSQIERIKELLETNGWQTLKDMFDEFTPEQFHIKLFSKISEIPVDAAVSDELWFEGDFLAIYSSDLRYLNHESKLDVLKKILNGDFKKD